MPVYEILALISLMLTAFAAYAMFLQTHMPPVKRARPYMERQEYVAALRAAMNGIGQVPWAWINNEEFLNFVINWIATEKELKGIAQEAFSHIATPHQDFQDIFSRWLNLINDAEKVTTLAVQRQLTNYNEATWNTLSLDIPRAKNFDLQQVPQ